MPEYSLDKIIKKSDMEFGRELEKQIKRLGFKKFSEKEWQHFLPGFIYHTNAIEGSKLSLNTVERIVETRDAFNDEEKEVIGVYDALDRLRKTGIDLSPSYLEQIHGMIFKGTKKHLRRTKGDSVIVGNERGAVYHYGQYAVKVENSLNELNEWFAKNKEKYSPFSVATAVHNQLLNIHPFNDGNGRISRVMLNGILDKFDLPLVNIYVNHRDAYYAALQEHQINQNLIPTLCFLFFEYNAMKGVKTIN